MQATPCCHEVSPLPQRDVTFRLLETEGYYDAGAQYPKGAKVALGLRLGSPRCDGEDEPWAGTEASLDHDSPPNLVRLLPKAKPPPRLCLGPTLCRTLPWPPTCCSCQTGPLHSK
jgi:hypothetical protein